MFKPLPQVLLCFRRGMFSPPKTICAVPPCIVAVNQKFVGSEGRSDLIPSAMLDSMTVGLNIIFLDNDGPNVPITKVVVKKTRLSRSSNCFSTFESPCRFDGCVACLVVVRIDTNRQRAHPIRIFCGSDFVQRLHPILTFRSFVSATEYRKRCLLFIP